MLAPCAMFPASSADAVSHPEHDFPLLLESRDSSDFSSF
ncbi:predicted protein [Botrytis cinerea T4]|uniref:Uncharacterized protein n=1 Tax=Botryotinia fuckeliana (strain T4) TaxID=999810 RepID=G2Y1U5_BOTF4|nr:predicted protein [Botrytis cinerea T4]